MTKTEARQLLMKHLLPRIEQFGFKERGKSSEFEIVRKTANGEDIIGGGFTDYFPVQRIIYGTGKCDKRIINILLELQKAGIALSPPVNKKTTTFSVSYETQNHLNYVGYLPDMETETDVVKCVGMMVDFLEGTAFPLLDKFEDLREIDQLINGPEPWDTDWQKPYRFGGNFAEKRIIIAKLSGNANFQELVDFTYKALERLSAESGHPFVYDRANLSKPLPALIELLKDIKPLY